MTRQWMSWVNCFIAAIICCLFFGMAMIWIRQPSEITCNNPTSKQCRLPKNSFSLSDQSYDMIGEPLLSLQSAPPTIQVPDLKQHLIYYGKNGRPDAISSNAHLHFAFTGNKNVATIKPSDKLYLIYDKKAQPCHYVFSPNNCETSLWLECTSVDNEAHVKVIMKDDKGGLITEPEHLSQIKVTEKEYARYGGVNWEIGGLRVDGTLLARQKARWYGADRFLEKHGGEEYKHVLNKQKIDFGEGDGIYSVFVEVGDCLIWNGQQWKEIQPSEKSLDHPLLLVKKIDDRIMSFELWDVGGKGKVLLNLLKSSEPWLMQNPTHVEKTFKFVGARTRTQCVFEINQKRMVISPSDWLLLTPKGWVKLSTENEIDQYVKRKTPGTLFVFEGLARKDDRQIMTGTLFSPNRSDIQSIELPIQQPRSKLNLKTIKKDAEEEESDEDGEDDDDDCDDDDDEIDELFNKNSTRNAIKKNDIVQHKTENVHPFIPAKK